MTSDASQGLCISCKQSSRFAVGYLLQNALAFIRTGQQIFEVERIRLQPATFTTMTQTALNPAYPLACVTPFMTNKTRSARLSRTPPARTLLSLGSAIAATPPAGLTRSWSWRAASSSKEDRLARLRCRLAGLGAGRAVVGNFRRAGMAFKWASRASFASKSSSVTSVGASVHNSCEPSGAPPHPPGGGGALCCVLVAVRV